MIKTDWNGKKRGEKRHLLFSCISAAQLITVQYKSKYSYVQHPIYKSCNIFLSFFDKAECFATSLCIVSATVWMANEIIFSRCQGACLFGTRPFKNHFIAYKFLKKERKSKNDKSTCNHNCICPIWCVFTYHATLNCVATKNSSETIMAVRIIWWTFAS